MFKQYSPAALHPLIAVVAALSTLGLGDVAQAADFKGTSGNDRLWGSPFRDNIQAVAGNDQVHALGGGDFVMGDQGRDFLFGGDGPDHMYGANGDDKVLGERGNDRLRGGAGADTLLGGPGNDEVGLTLGLGHDYLSGGKGNDVLTSGGDGRIRDVIDCGPGYDVVYADQFDAFAGGSADVAGCEELHLLP